MIGLKVDFEGGLQTDFKSPQGISLEVEQGTTLRALAKIVLDRFKPEGATIRFIDDAGDVLPGILVMINGADSAIDGFDVTLEDKDEVTYISTLHGG